MRGKRKPSAAPEPKSSKKPAAAAKKTKTPPRKKAAPPPPPPRKSRRDPPAIPPRTLRPVAELTVLEIIAAITRQADPGTAAFELRVDPIEFSRALAENDTLKTALRIARTAADEFRATKIALSAPFAASQLTELAQNSGPQDSVRQGALNALLTQAALVRKADLSVAPAEKVEWPRPGPLPVRLVVANPAAQAPPSSEKDDADDDGADDG